MLKDHHFQDANSQFVYDLIVPRNHFLRRLNELMDWEDLAKDIFRVYKGGFRLGTCHYLKLSSRQTASKYLQTLEKLGYFKGKKLGRHKFFYSEEFVNLLS